MSIINGIGDEVTHFFIALGIIIVVSIAWITTDIRQQWNIRTVYLLDRRRVHRSRRLTNHTESATISEGRDPVEGASSSSQGATQATAAENKPAPAENAGGGEGATEVREHEEEQLNIIRVMDDDITNIRRQIDQMLEIDPLLDEMTGTETNVTRRANRSADTETTTECEQPTENAESTQDGSNITVKLKYINDDLKIVDARLGELVGDFKRRHFETELSSNKYVRLIFNGQVMLRETDTLANYGLFNNCVVHCLIHQRRTTDDSSATAENTDSTRNVPNSAGPQRDWDLGNLLIGTVSFCLGTAWYFRYQYPQLFTVTATVGLVAITGIFTVISLGMYFPDAERPAEPQRVNVNN